MSRLDVYISRYGNFCAHDDNDNDDTTDYFTPCACARGKYSVTSCLGNILHGLTSPLALPPSLLTVPDIGKMIQQSHTQTTIHLAAFEN